MNIEKMLETFNTSIEKLLQDPQFKAMLRGDDAYSRINSTPINSAKGRKAFLESLDKGLKGIQSSEKTLVHIAKMMENLGYSTQVKGLKSGSGKTGSEYNFRFGGGDKVSAELNKRIENLLNFELNLVNKIGVTSHSGNAASNQYVRLFDETTGGIKTLTQVQYKLQLLEKELEKVQNDPNMNIKGATDKEMLRKATELSRILKDVESKVNIGGDDLLGGVKSKGQIIEAYKERQNRAMTEQGAKQRSLMFSTKYFAQQMQEKYSDIIAGIKDTKKQNKVSFDTFLKDLDRLSKIAIATKDINDVQRAIVENERYAKYARSQGLMKAMNALFTQLNQEQLWRNEGLMSDSAQNKFAVGGMDVPLHNLLLASERKIAQTQRGIGQAQSTWKTATGKQTTLSTGGMGAQGKSMLYNVATVSQAAYKEGLEAFLKTRSPEERKALERIGFGGARGDSVLFNKKYLENLSPSVEMSFNIDKNDKDFQRHLAALRGKKKMAGASENALVEKAVYNMLKESYERDNPYGGKFKGTISGARKLWDDSGWNFTVKDALPGGSFKGLNAIGSGRFNMQAIEEGLMRSVLVAQGYTEDEIKYIDAIQTASSEIKAKNVYDYVRGTIEYVNNQYLQAVKEVTGKNHSKEDLNVLANELNKQFKDTGIGSFSVSNGMITFSDKGGTGSFNPSLALEKAGGYAKLIKGVGKTRGLGKSHALGALSGEDFFVLDNGVLQAKQGRMITSQSFLRFYNGENDIYDPDNPFSHDSRTYGFREINALKRTAGLLSGMGGSSGKALEAYVNSLTGKVSQAEYSKQLANSEMMRKIATNAGLTKEDLTKNGGLVISASDLAGTDIEEEAAFDKSGRVSGDYIKNLLMVQKLRQEMFDANKDKYGWTSVEDVPLFVDPGRFFGRKGTGGKSGFSGRYFALPRFGNVEEGEDSRYSASQAAIIANRMLSGAQRFFGEAENSTTAALGLGGTIAKNMAEYNQMLYSKEGGAFLAANKAELPNALMALATPSEVNYQELQDRAAVILNREDVAEQLHGMSDQELRNVYKDIANQEAKEDISKTKLVNNILDTLTVGNKSFTGKGLLSIMNRFPTLLGLGDLLGVETFVAAEGDENIGRGNFGVNPILWSIINGDWDGDKTQLNLLLKNVTPELRSDIEKAAQLALKKKDLLEKMDANGDQAFNTTDKDLSVKAKVSKINKEYKEKTQERATFLKSVGKDYVGLFSNVREGLNSVFFNSGLDLGGGAGASAEDRQAIAASEFMRAFAQIPEQTVISIKKKASSLKGDEKTILDDFLYNYWGNASSWGTKENFKKIIEKGQEIGIFNEGKSVFGDDFTADRAVVESWINTLESSEGQLGGDDRKLLSTIVNKGWMGDLTKRDALLEKIGKAQNLGDVRKDIEDAIGDRQLGVTKKLLEFSYDTLDNYFKNNDVNITGKFGNTLKIGGLESIVRNIYNGALKGVGSTNDWLSSSGVLNQGVYDNLRTLGLADAFGAKGKITGDNLKEIGAHFTGLDTFFADFAEAVEKGNFGAGPSRLAHTADGYYIPAGGAGNISDYDLTDFLQDLNEKTAQYLADPNTIPQLLANTEDNQEKFSKMRSQYFRSQYGTDIHKIAELINTGANLNESQEFREITARSQLLFGNTNYANNARKLGELASQLAGRRGRFIGSEMQMNGFNAASGKAMAMSMDQLVVDDQGNLHIIDYKNHAGGKTTAGDKVQPLIYKAQALGLRNALTREGITAGNIGSTYESWLKGGLDKESPVGKILDAYFTVSELGANGEWGKPQKNAKAGEFLKTLMGLENPDEQIIADLISINSTTGAATVASHKDFGALERGLVYKAMQEDYGLNSEESLAAIGKLYGLTDEGKANLEAIEGMARNLDQEDATKAYEEEAKNVANLAAEIKKLNEDIKRLTDLYGSEDQKVKDLNTILSENIDKYNEATEKAKAFADAAGKGEEWSKQREADLRESQHEQAIEDEKKQKEYMQGFKESLKSYQQYQKNQWSLEARYKKAHGTQKDLIGAEMGINKTYLEESEKNLQGYAQSLTGKRKDDAAKDIDQAQKALNLQKAHIDASAKASSLWGQIGNTIKSSFYRMTIFSTVYKMINKIPQALKQVVEYAKQLDKVMVNIQVVTNSTREEANKLMQTYAQLAKQLGATVAEVAQSANVWFNEKSRSQ